MFLPLVVKNMSRPLSPDNIQIVPSSGSGSDSMSEKAYGSYPQWAQAGIVPQPPFPASEAPEHHLDARLRTVAHTAAAK